MPNRNEQIIALLSDAIADLEQSKTVLADAKATTDPVVRAEKLRAAIARHEETRSALKNAKFIYNNGPTVINTRLKFNFHKTVAETDADKWDVLEALEPIANGAFDTIAA